VVTSFRASALAYSHGLRKPRGGLPAAISLSLIRLMTDAKMGEEHDVPSTPPVEPLETICTFSPWAETSGYPRPVVLKRPLLVVVPCALRKAATASDW
jgi:hypothetical protein